MKLPTPPGPMFDIENSTNVNIKNNTTEHTSLLKAKNIKSLSLEGNHAGVARPTPAVKRSLWKSIRHHLTNIVVTVVAGLFLTGLVYFLGWK